MAANKRIDKLLVTGKWAVDYTWGTAQYESYLMNLALLDKGSIQYTDLDISSQRHLSKQIDAYSVDKITPIIDADGWGMYTTKAPIDEPTIAKITISGVMTVEGTLSGIGMRDVAKAINALGNNDLVKGLLLDVYSGGGAVLAAQVLYNAVQEFKKPVGVHTTLLGSGAVFGTLPADFIMAAGDAAEIGSIGTLYSLDKEFIEFYKETFDDIYSSESPDKNKAFRQYLEGDSTGFRKEADTFARLFKDLVTKHRPLNSNMKESTLKGGMFMAKDAKRRGLVDYIGGEQAALKKLKSLIK